MYYFANDCNNLPSSLLGHNKLSISLSNENENSFRLSAAYFWNSLPSDITSAPSLAIFKARLMSHIRLRELPVP